MKMADKRKITQICSQSHKNGHPTRFFRQQTVFERFMWRHLCDDIIVIIINGLNLRRQSSELLKASNGTKPEHMMEKNRQIQIYGGKKTQTSDK